MYPKVKINSLEKIQINGIKKQPLKKKEILSLIRFVCRKLNLKPGYLEISFITDKMMKDYNKTYLNHDCTTDIITFDYSISKENISAEILISTETALNNSKIFKNTFSEEMLRLITHGLLHISGRKDKTARQKISMRKNENEMLNKFYESSGE